MSYYETAEQRQIRELRNQINTYRSQLSNSQNENRRIQQQIEQSNSEHRRAEQRLESMLNQQRQQNQNLSNSLNRLNREVEQQERKHRQQIEDMKEKHNADIKRQNQRIKQEAERLQAGINQTRAELESVRRHTQEEFADIREQRERDLMWTRDRFNETNQRIDEIQQQLIDEKTNQQEIAEYWIQQAQRVRSEINENYRPEKFEPEKWDSLNQDIRDAETNLNIAPQAAIVQGRNAFRNAVELRSVLLSEEMEWQETLSAVRTIERQVLESIEEAKNREYEVVFDDEKIIDDRGVDYWTHNQLSVLERRVQEAESKLNADTENLTTEQLRELEQEFTIFLQENALLENAAHTNLAMARARVDMAERIGEVLGDQWLMTVADGNYFKEEPRDEYHAVFYNPQTKDEAVVVINPEPDENGVVTNHIEVIINPNSNNSEDRAAINNSIIVALSRYINGFNLPCSEKYGERTAEVAVNYSDIEAVTNGDESVRTQDAVIDSKGNIINARQKPTQRSH